jgi:hypothetical protein
LLVGYGNNKCGSAETIGSDGGIDDGGHEGDMVLDVVEGAEVDHHQVDNLQDKGDHCVGNRQSVVEVQVIVFRQAVVVVESITQVGSHRGSDGNSHCDGELEDEVEGSEDVSETGRKLVGTEGDQ